MQQVWKSQVNLYEVFSVCFHSLQYIFVYLHFMFNFVVFGEDSTVKSDFPVSQPQALFLSL